MAARKPDAISPRKIRAPTGEQVQAAREKAKLQQTQAAALVQSTARRWREWEAGDHRMHPGLWELFLIRTQAIIMAEPADLELFTDHGDAP